MGRAFGYIRVSTEHQDKSGLGAEAQRLGILKLHAELVAPQGITLDPENIKSDPAVSAAKWPFAKRPGGGWIDAQLMPGDVLIIYKLDRAFRSLLDMLTMLRKWDDLGVRVYSVDFLGTHYDSTSPTGKIIAWLFGMMAELETDRLKARCKDRIAVARVTGRAAGTTPWGFMTVKGDGQNQKTGAFLHRCDQERWIASELLSWLEQGHLLKTITNHARRIRLYNPRTNRPFSKTRIFDIIKIERRIREIEAAAKIDPLTHFVTMDGILRKRRWPMPDKWMREEWKALSQKPANSD